MTDSAPLELRVADYRLEDSLGFLVHRLRSELFAALEAETGAYDITAAQWVILMLLGHGHARTAAELARCLGSDTGSMTRMIDRLEDKGLIGRQRSASDRRVVLLALSASAEALLPQLPVAAVNVLRHFLRGFTVDEYAQLTQLLRRVLANADAAP
ncbi:MarR family winged helix-turn-helix transcriptional regulator [Plasticicumulans acidivorans]|uniref:MarR family transcriptional regulator n=1 Tax=Plasticicumulans acidivorans TaxID=886464 RepID=A0A317MRA4_9GAMM|nr:MarR family transcriptional regulator [Plasticicumulans acidivorans]PWV59137.1 MarR family transcriptional regulator [Plasticicumulans acidivorans]